MTIAREILNFGIAVVLVPVALPLTALAVLAVKLETPGDGIFAQRRVGRHGKLFTCYKVRTMYRDTPHVASHDIGKSQVTRVGAVLRKTRLDELPQLWNVLRNDMRLVGPRPCLETQVELIEARKALGVDQLHPGITGVAQALHIDMSQPEKLASVDATYIGRVTARTDLIILAQTASGLFKLPDFARKTEV